MHIPKFHVLVYFYYYLFVRWIGDKQNQKDEIEETLKLTATIPSHIAVDILDVPELEVSSKLTLSVLAGPQIRVHN